MRRATVGKVLGVAGVLGVAATGVVLARDERRRRAYGPDDVRERLHARAELIARATDPERPESGPPRRLVAVPTPDGDGDGNGTTRLGRLRQRLTGWLRLSRRPAAVEPRP